MEASEGVRYDETMASRRVDRASSTSVEVCGAVCSHVGSRDRICCCCCSASALAAALVGVGVSVLVPSSNEKLVVGSRKFRLLLVPLEVPLLTNGAAARCTKAWDGRRRASRATAAAAVVLRRWFVLPVPLALLPDIGRVVDTAGAQVEVPLRGRLLPGDGGHADLVVVIAVGINIASVDMGGGGSVVSMPMTEGRHKNIIYLGRDEKMRFGKTKDTEGSKQKERRGTDAGTIHLGL